MLPSALLWALLYHQHYQQTNINSNGLDTNTLSASCQINPQESYPAPLLLDQNGFIYPPGSGYSAIFLDHPPLYLACPGGYLTLNGVPTNFDYVSASCHGGNELIIENQRYKWRSIKCSKNPSSNVRRTSKPCFYGGSEYEIGFRVSSNRFIPIMKICFNEFLQTTLYSYANITRAVNQGVRTTRRPYWDDAFFGNYQLNQLYTRISQRQNINQLLGLNNSDRTFIKDNDYFLARGHLIAKSDYFYSSQQNATFFFLNALPQWQSFNGGNWRTAEINIHDYAEKYDVDLQVWTGGYGITTLPHKDTGRETELYLYVNGMQKKVPVPEYFWKIVYEPISQRGIVLLGTNNPYKRRHEINPICSDVSTGIRWLTWDPYDQHKGYTWACDVEDFQRRVDIIPELQTEGLLV